MTEGNMQRNSSLVGILCSSIHVETSAGLDLTHLTSSVSSTLGSMMAGGRTSACRMTCRSASARPLDTELTLTHFSVRPKSSSASIRGMVSLASVCKTQSAQVQNILVQIWDFTLKVNARDANKPQRISEWFFLYTPGGMNVCKSLFSLHRRGTRVEITHQTK